jgi:hypothetical protein
MCSIILLKVANSEITALVIYFLVRVPNLFIANLSSFMSSYRNRVIHRTLSKLKIDLVDTSLINK